MYNKDDKTEYTPLWVKLIGGLVCVMIGAVIGAIIGLQLITWYVTSA